MKRALVLVALLLLPTFALADHVYSHRFVVDGRLVGSDGLPLPGRDVIVVSERDDFLEPCREGPHQSITDEWGDFRFCFHHHDLTPGARVGVKYGNTTEPLRPVDIAFRRVNLIIQEPNETGIAPPAWNETYRISGRAWQPGPVLLEGVQVFGTTVSEMPVNLTIRLDEGGETFFQTMTDAYGDFNLIIETPTLPSNASVIVEALGRAQPTQLTAVGHRTWTPIYVAGEEAPTSVRSEADVPDHVPSSAAPGSTTPRVNPVLVVALVLAFVAAIYLSRRKVI